jgi:hypothetical protein
MFRNALEQCLLRKGPLSDSGFEEAPEIVVVARHSELPRFVGGAEGFFVEQAGLLPEGTLGSEDADRERGIRVERGEALGDVGLDGFHFMRPIVGTGTEFDFHDRAHIASGLLLECGRIVEEQALAIGHVRVNFDPPVGVAKGG